MPSKIMGVKRGHLYQAAKFWGDLNSLQNGTVLKRIYSRRMGKYSRRGLNKLGAGNFR